MRREFDFSYYQLAFTTPGISPRRAKSRKQSRHISNFRKKARGRPHKGQRLYSLELNFAFRFAFAISDFLAIDISYQFSSFSCRYDPGTESDPLGTSFGKAFLKILITLLPHYHFERWYKS